jgi:hypothetical protein
MENSIGEIIQKFLPQLLQKKGVSKYQLKVLNALKKCRTPDLGGSVMACSSCGTVHYVMHSCRNRHCPRCQGIDRELWIEARKQELLPVKYFHVVFTVPHELLEIFRFNKKTMYNLLFEKAWEALCIFASDKKLLGAKIGAIAILHTWDQLINYHPHLHFIVPAGGIGESGAWVSSKSDGDFLFDVKHMSAVFSARFAEKLRKLKKKGEICKFVPKDLIKNPWVVYAKQAFGSPHSVVEYLGRYTHRVAISNARILKVTGTHVTFRWCDRANNYKVKTETVTGLEFLERFIQHIVPPYFRRIRHLGFLSSRNKAAAINAIRRHFNLPDFELVKISRAEVLAERFGSHSVLHCRECGGQMVVVEKFDRPRAPPKPSLSEALTCSFTDC